METFHTKSMMPTLGKPVKMNFYPTINIKLCLQINAENAGNMPHVRRHLQKETQSQCLRSRHFVGTGQKRKQAYFKLQQGRGRNRRIKGNNSQCVSPELPSLQTMGDVDSVVAEI